MMVPPSTPRGVSKDFPKNSRIYSLCWVDISQRRDVDIVSITLHCQKIIIRIEKLRVTRPHVADSS